MDSLLPVILGLVVGISLIASFAILMPVRDIERSQFSEFAILGSGLPLDVTSDSTGVYVGGSTSVAVEDKMTGPVDSFIRKYDHSGHEMWARQFGEIDSISEIRAVATDSTAVYVVGSVRHDPTGSNGLTDDAFIRKYQHDGLLLWTHDIKSNTTDGAYDVAADSSRVFVVGHTLGDLDAHNSGQTDVFVRIYDASGTMISAKQFGTANDDYANGVAVDTTGVYVVGGTYGDLDGAKTGIGDTFIRKLGIDGTEIWTDQFGYTDKRTEARAIATDKTGIYLVGYSQSPNEEGVRSNASEIIRKYDPAGRILWADETQINHTSSIPLGVATDFGGVYVASQYSDEIISDVYSYVGGTTLRKYAPDGELLWQDSFDPSREMDLALNLGSGTSRIYMIAVEGQGEESAGESKAFLVNGRNSSLAPKGELVFSEQS